MRMMRYSVSDRHTSMPLSLLNSTSFSKQRGADPLEFVNTAIH